MQARRGQMPDKRKQKPHGEGVGDGRGSAYTDDAEHEESWMPPHHVLRIETLAPVSEVPRTLWNTLRDQMWEAFGVKAGFRKSRHCTINPDWDGTMPYAIYVRRKMRQ